MRNDYMAKMCKLKLFYLFKLITDDTLTFFSGVFVATSINILTSQIPNSILSLGKKYLVIAGMIFVSAFMLIKWAAFIKPILSHYTNSSLANQTYGNLQSWYNVLGEHKAFSRLITYFIITVLLLIISIGLLISPNITDAIFLLFTKRESL